MLLILDQTTNEFSQRLRCAAERKGMKAIHLTSAEIVRDLALAFYLSEHGTRFRFSYGGDTIESADIDGVYCGLEVFTPALWGHFSPDDAEYAAQETQALWLAVLSSLPCRVVNPPAMDTLAGTLLSPAEVFEVARQLGLHIPMVITLESGKVATELLADGFPAYLTDLGDDWLWEKPLMKPDLPAIAKNVNHLRVREEVPGKRLHVALVGNRFFASSEEEQGKEDGKADGIGGFLPLDARCLPRPVKIRLKKLQDLLNLNLAEYSFRIMADGSWVFTGVARPPRFAPSAYGDGLFDYLVDYLIGKV